MEDDKSIHLKEVINLEGGSIYTVKAADLAPVMDALTSNAAVIVPFGVGLIAVFAGIRLVPKLIKNFTRG